MGWWGSGIMEGDTPADIWDDIVGLLPVPKDRDGIPDKEKITASMLYDCMPNIVAFLEVHWSGTGDTYPPGLAWQVLCHKLRFYGAAVPKRVWKRGVKSALDEMKSVASDNPNRDMPREGVLMSFVADLNSYRRTRWGNDAIDGY